MKIKIAKRNNKLKANNKINKLIGLMTKDLPSSRSFDSTSYISESSEVSDCSSKSDK